MEAKWRLGKPRHDLESMEVSVMIECVMKLMSLVLLIDQRKSMIQTCNKSLARFGAKPFDVPSSMTP